MKNVLQVQMEPKATRVQDDNPEDLLFRERLQWEPNRPLLQGTQTDGYQGRGVGEVVFTEAFSGSQIRWNKPLKLRWVDDPSPALKCILGWWSIPYWRPIPDTRNDELYFWQLFKWTVQMSR